jgi:hypothetical protein
MMPADDFSLQWAQFGAALTAIGALGVAAFGVVESLGKALAFAIPRKNGRRPFMFGLPYAGLGAVAKMAKPLAPALKLAYGAHYIEIIAQQYRSDRSAGKAPDTIRQGVRLGLPFMTPDEATAVIQTVWEMDPKWSKALADALRATAGQGDHPALIDGVDPAALAGRFATGLDARINAAFALAEAQYETWAKTLSGAMSVVLALTFNWGLGAGLPNHGKFSWAIAVAIGVVAVPLAPVAKDLASSLQGALNAFKSIPSRKI